MRLEKGEVGTLSGGAERGGCGCFLGLLFSLLVRLPLKLLQRLFRTLLFFLAARDALDAAVRLFHESYLLETAIVRVTADRLANDGLAGRLDCRALRQAVDRTWTQADPRPVRKTLDETLRGSWGLLRSTARRFGRLLARRSLRTPAEVEEAWDSMSSGEQGRGMVDRLSEAISHESAYLTELRRLLDAELVAAGCLRPSPLPDPSSRPDDESPAR